MLNAILQGRFMRHSMLSALSRAPVGFWLASLILDILSAIVPEYSEASLLCMGLGLLSALLAAPAEIAELSSLPHGASSRKLALGQLALGSSAVVLYAIDFLARRTIPAVPTSVPIGLMLLSLGAFALFGASRCFGGMIEYDNTGASDAGVERAAAA